MDAKMKVERAAAGAAIDGVLKYVNHGDDRTKALLNLTDFVQKFTGNIFAEKTFDNIRTMLQNPDNKWVQYVNRGLDELDPQVIKMTALNLGFQAAFVGTKQIRMNREKYNCNIPWTMLMDPTSACNLHCTGCWAAEYGHKLNLSYEKLSDIISQGKKLGTYFYMFTGGEPLLQAEFVEEFFAKLHEHGVHTALDTSGVGNLSKAEKVLAHTDMVLCDLKFLTKADNLKTCRADFDQIERFLQLTAMKNVPLWIRHVVVPGLTDGMEHLRRVKAKAESYPNFEKLEFLPFHKLCMEKYERLGLEFPLKDTPAMNPDALKTMVEQL